MVVQQLAAVQHEGIVLETFVHVQIEHGVGADEYLGGAGARDAACAVRARHEHSVGYDRAAVVCLGRCGHDDRARAGLHDLDVAQHGDIGVFVGSRSDVVAERHGIARSAVRHRTASRKARDQKIVSVHVNAVDAVALGKSAPVAVRAQRAVGNRK